MKENSDKDLKVSSAEKVDGDEEARLDNAGQAILSDERTILEDVDGVSLEDDEVNLNDDKARVDDVRKERVDKEEATENGNVLLDGGPNAICHNFEQAIIHDDVH